MLVWQVRPTPSRARRQAGWAETVSPHSATLPALGGKSPQITLNSVVLPVPFGPRIARCWPG